MSAPPHKIKLLKYLILHSYVPSSKHARRLLSSRRVLVNGVLSTSASLKVSSLHDPTVVVVLPEDSTSECEAEAGEGVKNGLHEDAVPPPLPPQSSVLLLYNKPCGMICSLSGTAPNLQNITPPLPIDYHPVGRLDEHSHGLFIFSKGTKSRRAKRRA